ncbi:hypothetical protein ACWDO7_14465 [Streptomyces sp. NPDC003656]
MNASLSHRRLRRAGLAGTLCAVLVALSGCSGDAPKREYAAPRSLCGTPVESKELYAFLPPGKKVSSQITKKSANVTWCALTVDGKKIVRTSQEWWEDMSMRQYTMGLTPDALDHQTKDRRFIYSGYLAYGKITDCDHSKHRVDRVLYTGVQAFGSKHRDPAAMKKLIVSYTEAVEKSSACR